MKKKIVLEDYTLYKRLFWAGIFLVIAGCFLFLFWVFSIIGEWGVSSLLLTFWGFVLLMLLFEPQKGLFGNEKGREYELRLEQELKEKGFLFYFLWRIGHSAAPKREKI